MKTLILLLFRTARTSFVAATIVSIIAGAANSALIALIQIALASVDEPKGATLYLLVCLTVLVAALAAQTLLLRIAQDMLLQVRTVLTRQILAAPLRQLEQVGPSRLLAALTEDVTTVATGARDVPAFFSYCTSLVACFAYMAWLSWKAFLLVGSLTTFGVLVYAVTQTIANRYFNAARDEKDRTLYHLQGLIDGIKELKLSHSRRRYFTENELDPSLRALRKSSLIAQVVLFGGGHFTYLLFFVAIGLLLFARQYLFYLSPSVIVGCALAVLYLRTALEFIVQSVAYQLQAGISLQKLDSLGLALESVGIDSAREPALPAMETLASLEIANIRHEYRRENEQAVFTLGPISLSLKPGTIVFVTGGNGGGKSTLAKLIAGLYLPESGDIRLNGTLVENANREWYRQHFSCVFMDYHLFDAVLTDEKHQLSTAEELLRDLRLDKKVTIENGSFSTTALSSGQRRRLALISAVLDDRPIYIFDEWASDQDPVFKRVFYLEILKTLKERGKLVIVISHDERYFGVADATIKLDDGRLSDEETGAFVSRHYA